MWPLGSRRRLSSAWFTVEVYADRFDPRTRLHKMLLNPARSKSISAVNSPLFRANFAYSPLHAHGNRVVPFHCRVGWFGRDLCLVERKISMVSSDLTGGGWMLIVEIYGERWCSFRWNFVWLLDCIFIVNMELWDNDDRYSTWINIIDEPVAIMLHSLSIGLQSDSF